MAHRTCLITKLGDGRPRARVGRQTIKRAYKGRLYQDSSAAYADRGIVPRIKYPEPRSMGSALGWII